MPERKQDSRHAAVLDHRNYGRTIARRVWTKHGGAWLTWDDCQAESDYALVYAASKFDPSYGLTFRKYAGMVVRHHLSSALRRYRRRWRLCRPDETYGEEIDRQVFPDQLAANNDRIEQLRLYLHPKQYAFLRALYIDDMSVIEISKTLGITRSAAYQYLDRINADLELFVKKGRTYDDTL